MSEQLTIGQVRKKHAKRFKEFYAAYPKHVGPTEAEEVFAKLVEYEGLDPVKLIQSAKNYAMSVGQDLTYVPAPASWLKKGRYDDVDLFADERAAQINWLKQQWKTANVKAVEDRYHVTMPKQYPPDDITTEAAIEFWYRETARAWIHEVYKKRFECQTESQPTTSEPNKA
ncbi:hypothetical protein PP577_18450 [Mycobacteroides abscessus]|nr:hypothetical protein [Mycobacteroides abscessus]MDM2426888.1 hypothetical protein [Mycobacteroides abscessus]MDM2431782.1 hypothetical protein [Mycobacteroides abscessus]MDM2436606.1 hypothetical protein [Mycobacteroides abscessus]MDM2438905.1 hypothetical protein [Mycobacteroides abscessus]